MDRDEVVPAGEEVDLRGLDPALEQADPVEDDEDESLVQVKFWPLVTTGNVFQRQRVEAKHVGVAQRLNTFGVEDNFGTGRLATFYRYYFREKAYVEAGGAYLSNFEHTDDYETDAKAALVAPLGGMLALKVGYNYHYRNAPPPGFRQWDSTFSSGIQLTY